MRFFLPVISIVLQLCCPFPAELADNKPSPGEMISGLMLREKKRDTRSEIEKNKAILTDYHTSVL
jgi:hypothetical protein